MNGAPLPAKHGFPARLIVAGLYGYVSATKWLQRHRVDTPRGLRRLLGAEGMGEGGPIKTESRIDVPGGGASVAAGTVAVAGVAWAPTRGIETSRCGSTTGAWQPARLGEVANDNTWVQWRFEWEASAGRHQLEVRATDATGATQTSEVNPPAPDGATGYHSRTVTIS